MLTETVRKLFQYIEPQTQTRIFKRLNGDPKFRIKGFTKIERASLPIILNQCKTDRSCRRLLESIVVEYLPSMSGDDFSKTDYSIPQMTSENGPGIIALAALQNQDETKIDQYFFEYEGIISAQKAQISEATNVSSGQPEIIPAQKNASEDDNMETYIGYIQEVKGYYNFWPVYEYLDGQCIKVEDAAETFPRFGNINISGERRQMSRELADQEIYVITFSTDDLLDNTRNDSTLNPTEFKLNYNALKSSKNIQNIRDIGLYPVLHPESGGKDFVAGDIAVEENADENDPALIQFGAALYGPYTVSLRGGKSYISIPTPEDYVVTGYVPKVGEILDNCVAIPADREESVITYNIFCNRDCEKITHDLITDEQLVREFCESLSAASDYSKTAFTLAELSEAVSHTHDKVFPRTIDPEIRQKRLIRIKDLLANEDFRNQAYNDVTKIFANLFATRGNDDAFESLLEDMLEDELLSSKIQSFDIVRQNVAEKQAELKKLTSQIEDEKHRQQQEAQAEELIQLQETLRQANDELARFREDKQAQEKAAQAKKDYEFYDRSYKNVEDQYKKLKDNIDQTLKGASERAAAIAFEPMLSSKLLDAAASWQNSDQEEHYLKVAQAAIDFQTTQMAAEEVCHYICESVKKYRPGYQDNEILNIAINIVQSFLTVFSGNPGTGKTSICNIMAHILGLGKIQKSLPQIERINTGRYVSVSVERGWTTKRDFIGYYNPLSKQIEKANAHLYDGLRILSIEGAASMLPFLVLLDEANLSPMEYYWADFMNVCDANIGSKSINLGDAYQFTVPETCRFVATINNDHTTEILSPRLIDRATVIILPETEYQQIDDEFFEDDSSVQILSWRTLKSTFDSASTKELSRIPKDIFENQLCPCLKKLGITISPRTERAIKRYCSVAQELFVADDTGKDPSIIALDYAVAQHLLTKINGSGDDYRGLLEELKQICGRSAVNLTHCAEILGKILTKGDSSLHYYQFF